MARCWTTPCYCTAAAPARPTGREICQHSSPEDPTWVFNMASTGGKAKPGWRICTSASYAQWGFRWTHLLTAQAFLRIPFSAMLDVTPLRFASSSSFRHHLTANSTFPSFLCRHHHCHAIHQKHPVIQRHSVPDSSEHCIHQACIDRPRGLAQLARCE